MDKYPREVRSGARPLRERLLARDRVQVERLATVASELVPGDPDKGRAVFLSHKAACSTCHRAAGKGGGVGPNLSRIAFIRTGSELLESIIWPSASIDPEFRNWAVQTESGQMFAGLLVQETSDAIDLRSGPQTRDRVPISEIEDLKISRQSFMPDGIEKLITRQELSDLVEFLSRQH